MPKLLAENFIQEILQKAKEVLKKDKLDVIEKTFDDNEKKIIEFLID